MNNIQNSKKEVPLGFALNEKDYLTCLLSTLKEMEKNYALILTESSNETLYNELKTTFDSICTLQRKVYEQSFQYGWYTLECASYEQISQKLNTLSQEYQDLNS